MKTTKTSTSGTKPTGLNGGGLSAADICRIIRESRRCGVRKVAYQGLELHLGDETSMSPFAVKSAVSVKEPGDDVGKEIADSVAAASDLEALEEFQDMQLLIDDPAAHETLMIDRNLNQQRGMQDAENFRPGRT